jgi:hypothetical protein
VIRQSVEKVYRRIGGAQGRTGGRRRGNLRGRNQGNPRGGRLLYMAQNDRERGGAARESRGSEEDGWEWRATRGSPQEASTTTYQNKLVRAVQWLPDDDHCYTLSL